MLNRDSLDVIEKAAFLLCLEEDVPSTHNEVACLHVDVVHRLTCYRQFTRACWHGDGRNRFYDKSQLLVFANGRVGFNGEVAAPTRHLSGVS